MKPKHRAKLGGLFTSDAAPTISKPACFLAQQGDFVTATISFASPDLKAQAMKAMADKANQWEIDDRFDGLTVLEAADEIEIE